VQSTTDPRGLLSKTDYDLLGRTVRTIQNFVAFAPSNNADQTTQYTYDGSNHLRTLSAVLPGYVLETTTYSYGVTGSIINSNDLLSSVTYPANGQANTESYSYDALGETLTKADRNGTTHTYSYDILGRQTADAITTLGSGVDGAVRLLTTAYDTGGRPYLYTSYADTGGSTIVNQVEQIYNGLGQLITEYQSHAGAVNTSTTPSVQYAYSFVATSGGPNHSRLVSMTYPNGRVLNYNYNSGVDDRISRLSSISDSSATLEAYTYLGLNTVVTRSHPQTGINQTYLIPGGNTDGGDPYTGLDRFGRVVEDRWVNPNTNTVTDDFLYTYDRDGNRLTASNALDSGLSQQFTYDNLNQLATFTQGSHTQSWSLDAVGNWTSFTNDGSTQSRSFNNQNQLTAISGATTPTYDNNGNTTKDDQGTTYTLDAWNRIVKAVAGGTTLTYAYDALGRRSTTTRSPHAAVDAYFSSSWQVLEHDQQGVVQQQFVWSSVYVDGLVEQDAGSSRWYAQQDANWNVTAMLTSAGSVANRFVYDPYGKANVYDANWNLQGPLIGGLGSTWKYFFQGGRFDPITGLYNFRNRDHSPTLGRWMQEDPITYVGGINLYAFARARPTTVIDPFGESGPGAIAIGVGTAVGAGTGSVIVTTVIPAVGIALAACATAPYVSVKRGFGTIWTNDKWAHCVVSCKIARLCSSLVSLAGGAAYEVLQQLAYKYFGKGGGGDWADEKANLVGVGCAGFESYVPCGGWIGTWIRQSCETCCSKTYPPRG
jgi:RHS repeat-associated protein